MKERLFAAALGLASAAVVVWQVTHIAALLDLTFILDHAYRMAAGDAPYRDFPFVYPPLTVTLQSLLIRAFGTHYLVHAAYAIVLCAMATALAYWIVLRVLGDASQALLVCAPLAFLGTHDVLPHPFYDSDATFLMLAAVGAGMIAVRGQDLRLWAVAGALAVLPIFAKQNSGLVFSLLLTASLMLLGAGRARWFAAGGAAAAISLFLVALQLTSGLDNVARWTIGAASARFGTSRPVLEWILDPAVLTYAAMIAAGAYVLHRPVARVRAGVGAPLILIPFATIALFSVAYPAVLGRTWGASLLVACVASIISMRSGRISLGTLLPLIVAGTATGAFLSQGAHGSSYALWPMLAVAVASPIRALVRADRTLLFARVVLPALSLLMTVAGAVYTLSEARVDSSVRLDGALAMARTPALLGLTTPGPFLPEMDDAIAAIESRIPVDHSFIAYPGEDPIFFALARRPAFPVLQFVPVTNPFGAAELRRMRDDMKIDWVLVKTEIQYRPDVPTDVYRAALVDGYDLITIAGAYEFYRRR